MAILKSKLLFFLNTVRSRVESCNLKLFLLYRLFHTFRGNLALPLEIRQTCCLANARFEDAKLTFEGRNSSR